MISRKTLCGVIAVIAAIVAFLKQEFGLAIDDTSIIAGLTALLLYILFEAKLDLQKIEAQAGRFKDPKFWLAMISTILVVLQNAFGWQIPVEAIVAVLTVIMSVLFGVKYQQAK